MTRGVPWWGWLTMVGSTLYAAYNPSGYSVWHMWAGEIAGAISIPVRLLLTLFVLAAISIWCFATWRSLGAIGITVLIGLMALGLWIATDLGADPSSGLVPHLLPQALIAILLTIGLRWAWVWRRMTGQVVVDDSDPGP
jgi:hypothetical protein